jgi:Zn-finger nucleic acid-binding protein
VPLLDSTLSENLAVKNCSDCRGSWIPPDEYEVWQARQPKIQVEPKVLLQPLEDFVLSPLDSKAGLCPECNRYLSRAKVSLKTPFYVERCTNCGGIWCDQGEWNILEKLKLHATIQQLFSTGWQARVREQHHSEQERQAIVERVGTELANQVFEIAEILQKHPNGDFAAAYIMRRFERVDSSK